MFEDYVNSYYTQTRMDSSFPELSEDHDSHVCVIGGGLAGLNTAIGLAERGKSVVLLEGNKVAWGASGRNGGFVSSGYSVGTDDLEKKVGLAQTQEMYQLTKDAMTLIRSRIEKHDIDCQVAEGNIEGHLWDKANTAPEDAADFNDKFGGSLEYWDKDKTQSHYHTKAYKGAIYDPKAFHFHSLNYALGLAKAAVAAGVKIYENSRVVSIDESAAKIKVKTNKAVVSTDHIVLTCSGYIKGLYPKLSRATLPITTYVMVTEPLGDRLATVTDKAYSVIDERIACDYWRPLPDGSTRILWGGRVTAFPAHPDKVAQIMRKCMLRIYPHLADVKVETAWSGVMGYARHRMAMIGKIRDNVWYNTGYGGHGMAGTTVGGEVIASAIAEGSETYKLFEPFDLPYAGSVFGPIAAQSYYMMKYLKDEFKIWRG